MRRAKVFVSQGNGVLRQESHTCTVGAPNCILHARRGNFAGHCLLLCVIKLDSHCRTEQQVRWTTVKDLVSRLREHQGLDNLI